MIFRLGYLSTAVLKPGYDRLRPANDPRRCASDKTTRVMQHVIVPLPSVLSLWKVGVDCLMSFSSEPALLDVFRCAVQLTLQSWRLVRCFFPLAPRFVQTGEILIIGMHPEF